MIQLDTNGQEKKQNQSHELLPLSILATVDIIKMIMDSFMVQVLVTFTSNQLADQFTFLVLLFLDPMSKILTQELIVTMTNHSCYEQGTEYFPEHPPRITILSLSKLFNHHLGQWLESINCDNQLNVNKRTAENVLSGNNLITCSSTTRFFWDIDHRYDHH